MIAQLVIFDHWRLRLQLVVPGLCAKPCLASCVPECIRNPIQILHIISNIQKTRSRRLTNAMSTRTLPITFCPELIALVAGSANPPANWARGTIARRPAITWPWPVGVLTMLIIMASVNLTILMNIDVLLELLEGVLRSVGQGMEARMHVVRGQMPIRHHAIRGQGIVCREPVKGVRKHLECLA